MRLLDAIIRRLNFIHRLRLPHANDVSDQDRPRSATSRVVSIALPAFVLTLVVIFWMSPLRHVINVPQAASRLRSVRHEWWAPLLFIALYAVFDVALLPGTILTLTAGVVWGWLMGGVWVLVASTIGSAMPYSIARATAGGWMRSLMERRAAGLHQKLQNRGFLMLLLLRLVPIVPYSLLNYAAGLAGIPPRDYLLATLFGTIPGIFIFTYLADSLVAGLLSPREAFLRVVLSGLLLAGLLLTSRFFASRLKGRLEA